MNVDVEPRDMVFASDVAVHGVLSVGGVWINDAGAGSGAGAGARKFLMMKLRMKRMMRM